MGGYLFQNLISFTEEIVTYIKGGWVSNTDVTISYIHILFFFLHISTFMEKRGQWKWNFFCWTPPLDFMEIELDNTEDKLCFKTLLNIMLKFLLVILRDKLLLKMRFHIQLFNQWEHWEIDLCLSDRIQNYYYFQQAQNVYVHPTSSDFMLNVRF